MDFNSMMLEGLGPRWWYWYDVDDRDSDSELARIVEYDEYEKLRKSHPRRFRQLDRWHSGANDLIKRRLRRSRRNWANMFCGLVRFKSAQRVKLLKLLSQQKKLRMKTAFERFVFLLYLRRLRQRLTIRMQRLVFEWMG